MLAKVTDEIMHTVPASCTHWAEYCGSYVQCYKPFKHSYLKILSIRDFLPLVPKSHCTKNETSLALKNISWSYTPIWSKNQEQAKLLWAWTDVGFLCVCVLIYLFMWAHVCTHTHTTAHRTFCLWCRLRDCRTVQSRDRCSPPAWSQLSCCIDAALSLC